MHGGSSLNLYKQCAVTSLDKLIKDKGPILSGELLKALTNNEKALSNDAARKRLSRISGDIFRVRGLFTDGQILFHDKEIFGTEKYFSGLMNALKTSGKQYYLIIQALDFHYGYLKIKLLQCRLSPLSGWRIDSEIF